MIDELLRGFGILSLFALLVYAAWQAGEWVYRSKEWKCCVDRRLADLAITLNSHESQLDRHERRNAKQDEAEAFSRMSRESAKIKKTTKKRKG